nr:hypothetical protein [Tanacetum cinerariifolium]
MVEIVSNVPMVYVVNGVLASVVDIILEKDFVCFALQEMEIHPLMLLIRTLSMILQTFSPTLHNPSTSHTRMSYVGTILTMESTIPLNEIVSQIHPSIAITLVSPIKDLEDSLIMRDEDLSTIPKKELDELIKSSVEDFIPIPSDDIELLLHRDPSTLKMSIASILEGLTNELSLEENDNLFDLESKENEWKKILYDAPIDDLMNEDKVFDPRISKKKFSPTNLSLPFKDRNYLFLTYVIRICFPFLPIRIAPDNEDSRARAFVHRLLKLLSLACLYIWESDILDLVD